MICEHNTQCYKGLRARLRYHLSVFKRHSTKESAIKRFKKEIQFIQDRMLCMNYKDFNKEKCSIYKRIIEGAKHENR